MDQEGHHAITKEAVHALFSNEVGLADSQGLIRGMTEHEYFVRLDKAQEYQDRPVDPHTVFGPTTLPWWVVPAVQPDHFIGDPTRSGLENLSNARDRIVQEMVSALDQRPGHAEFAPLGHAMHGIEDSYSSAHAYRSHSVYEGDYKAPVQSMNVFDPTGRSPLSPGFPFTEGTHDPRADRIAVDNQGHVISGSGVAAARGVLDALIHYEHALKVNLDHSQASKDFHDLVNSLAPAAAGGVHLNTSYSSAEWRHERDHRLQLEKSSTGKVHFAPGDVPHTVVHLKVVDKVELSDHAGGRSAAHNLHPRQAHGPHAHDSGKVDPSHESQVPFGHNSTRRDHHPGQHGGRDGRLEAFDAAKVVEHPFNLHIPVPQLQPPHTESDHPYLNLSPPASTGKSGGPFDFHPTPPGQHGGLNLDVPPIHLGPYVDMTPLPNPDVPSGEPNPGNAERAIDHSLRSPEDFASDIAAQIETAIGQQVLTAAVGLHPEHAHQQKGEAEAAPDGAHRSSPHDPLPPKEPPTDHGQTDHAAPFGLHLPVDELHTGGRPDPSSADGHDSASHFNLHLQKLAAELNHPGATPATDRPEHSGADVQLDPTFGHGSGTPFKLELDPSAEHHGQGGHGFGLQLQRPGADGSDGAPAANPFDLHLNAQSPSEHPGAAHDAVHGTHGAPHDGGSHSHAEQQHQVHATDAAHMADVGHGGGG